MTRPAQTYGPFDVPHRVKMGLVALAPEEPWLELDADLVRDLREKRRLLARERDQVWCALPGSEAGQREALDLVANFVLAHPSTFQRRSGTRVRIDPLDEELDLDDSNSAALETASRLVQEDLCLMERLRGSWRLTAASVCFPTRWDLPSKLGGSLSAIHDAVPGYAGRVERAADHFFDALRPDLVFRRGNWSLLDDPALYQPTAERGGVARADITVANAGDRIWLRTERQTLRRLPRTGAILFTIRIHRVRLSALRGDPTAARCLSDSVRSMDIAFQRYKALERVREAALGYLACC